MTREEKVNILGTEYTVEHIDRNEDKNLFDNDGYCDWTTKRIVIVIDDDTFTVGEPTVYLDKVLRHEVIHAFMYESGLHDCATFNDEHFEQIVDWIAIQYPKIKKVFEQLGVEK